ncbi:hypothetical protein BFJ70_g15086 [Fusarium oxysporum]|nr:hypothetical protein BFJ70_g15086 [Fusarium oxysporum]
MSIVLSLPFAYIHVHSRTRPGPNLNLTARQDADNLALLDISIGTVLEPNNSLQLVEPWASEYVASIREARFGDPIWARYHMFGTIVDGFVEGSNQTVMEALEESAMEYRATVPDYYKYALSLYANTSSNDTHRDVLHLLVDVDLKEVRHLQERATFGYQTRYWKQRGLPI